MRDVAFTGTELAAFRLVGGTGQKHKPSRLRRAVSWPSLLELVQAGPGLPIENSLGDNNCSV